MSLKSYHISPNINLNLSISAFSFVKMKLYRKHLRLQLRVDKLAQRVLHKLPPINLQGKKRQKLHHSFH